MSANVYLCGPPGAGKSTVAPILAALRGCEAVDVDALIERETGTTIAALIDRDGEPAFRRRERRAIARLAAQQDVVVALGGGALEDPANRRAIASSGTLVFLDASVAACEGRTAAQAGQRPLLRAAGALARLHAARSERYREAAIRVAADGTPEEIARAIAAALTQTRVVHVATAQPYDVAIGAGVIDELPARVAPSLRGRVVIVTDARVDYVGARVEAAYRAAGHPTTLVRVRANERLKSLDALGDLFARFVAAGLDRRGLVVGVGGGTIGDAVGFAAATFQRGIPFAAVPTTLLSAVDASIGGKTAVNLPAGKNLVGTVTQPVHVAIAPHVLRTLPRRDVVSGYGEMLKYGLALDEGLYRALRATETALLDDPGSALDTIARCVALKAETVARDEQDRTGVRAILNFGHTVGHAFEKVAGYGRLRHGEAVILGMRAALRLSSARATLDARSRDEADAHLAALPIRPGWERLRIAEIAAATRHDKKQDVAGTQFVLLDAIGRARLTNGVAPDELHAALAGIGLR